MVRADRQEKEMREDQGVRANTIAASLPRNKGGCDHGESENDQEETNDSNGQEEEETTEPRGP